MSFVIAHSDTLAIPEPIQPPGRRRVNPVAPLLAGSAAAPLSAHWPVLCQVADGWLTALERSCGVSLQVVPAEGRGLASGAGAVCRVLDSWRECRPQCRRVHRALREEALAGGRLQRTRCVLGFGLVALPVLAGGAAPIALIECGPTVDPEQTETQLFGRLAAFGIGETECEAAVAAWRGQPRRTPEANEAVLELLRRVAAVVGEEYRRLRLGAAPHEPAAVVAAKRFAAANLGEPLALARVARVVGLSTDHFSRVFKRTTGSAWSDFVNDGRIAQAQELLARDAQRVVEVAYACGFESVTHFNRVFRRVVGTSPTSYRRSVREAAAAE